MPPSEKDITSALRTAVRNIFNSDRRADLSVNLVRKEVEEEAGLGNDFLKGPQWKSKSKDIILEENDKLLAAEENSAAVKSSSNLAKPKPAPVAKSKSESKRGVKRNSNGETVKPQKRRKKEDSPVKDSDGESVLSELSDSYNDVSDSLKPKKAKNGGQKALPKQESNPKVESKAKAKAEPAEDEGANDAPSARVKPEPASRKPKRESKVDVKHESKPHISHDSKNRPKDEDSKHSDIKPKDDSYLSDTKPSRKTSPDSKSVIKAGPGSVSESEMSVVYDEAPKPSKSSKSSKKDPSTTKSSSSSKPTAPDLSPTESKIKTLQSQLQKCGLRKIWAFELKPYGDDSEAKIRHLTAMLSEVGMDGRFSEARAKEIKEARELEADLEAVTEGAKIWGKGREGAKKERERGREAVERGTRALGKKTEKVEKESKVEERIVRAKQELAFLGEESDSD